MNSDTSLTDEEAANLLAEMKVGAAQGMKSAVLPIATIISLIERAMTAETALKEIVANYAPPFSGSDAALMHNIACFYFAGRALSPTRTEG